MMPTRHSLIAILTCTQLAAGTLSADSGEAAPSLRAAVGERLLIGTAVVSGQMDEPTQSGLISQQFNCITAGNEMKPDALQNVRGRFTFENADRIVKFAQAHSMNVIGHTLLWHNQAPKWLFQDEAGKPLPRDVALANLKTHITAVVKHFKGKVKGWDVVNEAISDGPEGLRDTPALRAIGDDYILKAFEFAHEADPDVELYYNDYNIELDYKRERALKLVKRIREAGLRIDAVGVQGHYLLEGPSIDEIRRGLKAYVDAGFKVMITELDVDPLPRRGVGGADLSAVERSGLDPYRDGFPPPMQEKLARRYAQLFELFLSMPEVTRVTLWGVTDADSWLNDFPVRGRTNHGMLFDRNAKPKPAFDAVMEVLNLGSKATSKPADHAPSQIAP